MVQDFFRDIREVSLIPDGKERWMEARGIGEILDERDHSFRTEYDGRMIYVYKVRDATSLKSDSVERRSITFFHKPIETQS